MLDMFQPEIACALLNIARLASSNAGLAELGWLSDILRSDIRILCLYSSMLAAPTSSLPVTVLTMSWG